MSAARGRLLRAGGVARLLAMLLCLVSALGLGACAPADRSWADTPQAIAGGGATGVYYAYGQQFARANCCPYA